MTPLENLLKVNPWIVVDVGEIAID